MIKLINGWVYCILADMRSSNGVLFVTVCLTVWDCRLLPAVHEKLMCAVESHYPLHQSDMSWEKAWHLSLMQWENGNVDTA